MSENGTKEAENEHLQGGKIDNLVMFLYRTGRELWSSVLSGQNSTANQRKYNEMTVISVGDIVIEISSFNLKTADAKTICDAIGFLVESDGSKFLIRRLSNDKLITWENAEFIKIPILTT